MIGRINLKNKKVTVMGLGLHGGGLAMVKWLHQQGAKITVTDLRDKKTLTPTLAKLKGKKIMYVLGKHRDSDFRNVDLVIKNPGVPRDSKYVRLAKKQGIPIETDMSLFFRLCPGPIIGITGTKGKSTTTALIYAIVKRAGRRPVMGGNIRISPLQFLSKIKKITPVVLELSSWQLEDMAHISMSPHIAVVTNILPDHLNRYKNMSDYAQSKKLIIAYQRNTDIAILNKQNQFTRKFGQNARGVRYWFSTQPFTDENGCFVRNSSIIFRDYGRETVIAHTSDIKIPGVYTIEHVLAAVVAAKTLGISTPVIRSAIREFKGIPDRLELIRKKNTRLFYNDTTATSPDAAIAALRSFSKKNIILLAGGFDKKLSYKKFASAIKKDVSCLILFSGTATQKLLRELIKIKFKKYTIARSMSEAVRQAWGYSENNSIILLSPGAASFGMFLNEFDRGDQFKQCVKTIR